MGARLLSWIRSLLRRLAAWLGRLGEERVQRIGPADSLQEPPEHWLRRAAPPPPAHWLARVRRALPLSSVDPAFPSPEPTGEIPQPAAPAPTRRRAEPSPLAPPRRSSPEAPPAEGGGSSRPSTPAAPPAPRLRVVTRIEEGVTPAKRAPEAPRPAEPPALRDPAPAPAPRRLFAVVEESMPPGDRLRPAPPLSPLPSAPRPRRNEAPRPSAPRPERVAPAVAEEPLPPRLAEDPERVPEAPATEAEIPAAPPRGLRRAERRPAADPVAAWPELPLRPAEADEAWRAGLQEAGRRRRLDLEQRGKPWSE